jgi:protein-tyrosine-phosphatase
MNNHRELTEIAPCRLRLITSAEIMEKLMPHVAKKASVLFVCIHNAGRSQMAAGYLKHLAGDRVEVLSAGTAPGNQVNPSAIAVMAEEGIDLSTATPKVLTDDAVKASDYVITMGCGDTCPFFPGKTYLDWPLEDPAGQGPDSVRPIRDEIRKLVEALITEIDQKF